MKHLLSTSLTETANYYESIISEVNELLNNTPEGTLRITHSCSKVSYYHIDLHVEKISMKINGKYIRRKDIGLAVALAQKDNDLKVLKSTRKDWLISTK